MVVVDFIERVQRHLQNRGEFQNEALSFVLAQITISWTGVSYEFLEKSHIDGLWGCEFWMTSGAGIKQKQSESTCSKFYLVRQRGIGKAIYVWLTSSSRRSLCPLHDAPEDIVSELNDGLQL